MAPRLPLVYSPLFLAQCPTRPPAQQEVVYYSLKSNKGKDSDVALSYPLKRDITCVRFPGRAQT